MIGAIFGDIVGSVYEFNNTKQTDFPLLTKWSRPTDDTIMTLAIARGLMYTWGKSDEETKYGLIRSMQKMGRKYPYAGYGRRFAGWLLEDYPRPYNSYGNGSGMRVSSVGWLCGSLDNTLHFAKLTAEVSHNHPEGIKGAQAIAASVFLARSGISKEDICTFAANAFHYCMDRTLDEIRPKYHFDVSCQGSVPEALLAFRESDNYEDAIRKAVSLGGDSDTIACMAGAIAEAYYGMPEYLKQIAMHFLDPECRGIVEQFQKFCHEQGRSEPDEQ